MEIEGLSFEETLEPNEVLALSEMDPETIFPDVEYQIENAGQRWFIILFYGIRVGYYSTVWPNKPEIYQFFICPSARRKGVGGAAGRRLVMDLLTRHHQVSLSAVDDIAFEFWSKALTGFAWTPEGDALRITKSPAG